MRGEEPPAPQNFGLRKVPVTRPDEAPQKPPWPHAPVHQLSENGIYFVTGSVFQKQKLFNTPEKLGLIHSMLLKQAAEAAWQLEAWAVLSNHYHFVARGCPDSKNLGEFVAGFHSMTAIALNKMEGVEGRKVWYNFWDTRLTYQYSYLARLKYVHQNAVKHKLVLLGNQYPWCSAAWFERTASPAQIKTIYSFKTDKVQIDDDY